MSMCPHEGIFDKICRTRGEKFSVIFVIKKKRQKKKEKKKKEVMMINH